MIAKEVKNLIESNAVALATTDGENPNVCVVADVKVIEGKILIGDNYMESTVNNLKLNDNVSLVVWNRDWEKDCFGYKISGTAEYINEGEWLDKVKEIHEGFPAKAAVLVSVSSVKRIGD